MSIEIYTAFERLALSRVWEFPNCSHIDVMLENRGVRHQIWNVLLLHVEYKRMVQSV